MSLMKFISDPDNAVYDAYCGLKCIYPSLNIDPDSRIVISNEITKNRVCVLSGGGSGHEPFAAGFVGNGMLSGSVGGFVFTSPPVQAIYSAICILSEQNNNAGVLIIVLNYTGDILNFGLATEKAKTQNINVEIVVVNEDCSRTDNEVQGAGKRGLCGSCLVFKLAGSMAARDKSLIDIAQECRLIVSAMSTLGATVGSSTIPGSGPLFQLNPDEIDIGLGIHGEAGILRIKLKNIEEVIEIIISKLTTALKLTAENEICVMLNNLGCVSQLEMCVLVSKIQNILIKRKLVILRFYSGTYMSSLDMAGIQICILNLTDHPFWLQYLDDCTEAPSWNGTLSKIFSSSSKSIKIKIIEDEVLNERGPTLSENETILFKTCLISIAEDLIKAETRLNDLDSLTGDGDCGSTLKRLAVGIMKNISTMKLEYPALCFYELTKLCQNTMGGSSGGLYGILFTGAAKHLISSKFIDWEQIWKAAINTLLLYSTAKIGDRTMIDVLVPAYEEFSQRLSHNEQKIQAFKAAVQIAELKCEETKNMKAKVGRASYVPPEYINDVDPGAYAVTIWLNSVLRVISPFI